MKNRNMMASPSKAPGLERVPWQGIGTPSCPSSLSSCLLEMPPSPFESSSWATPVSPINLCPEIITMARVASAQGFCDITKGLAPGAQSPSCEDKQTHYEHLPSPSLLTMWTLKWFLVLLLCLTCSYASMFSFPREKTCEPQGKVPCEGHFRIRQNLPEHAQGWLGSTWLWFLFVVVLFVILKYQRDNEKNKKQSPPGLRGGQFHSPLKKNNASRNKDCAFNTLHELDVELARFVSEVQSLKGAMATGNVSNLKLRRSETPTHPQRVTIYDIRGEESSS
ncbi:PREDICTED: protein FAM209B-like isoform X2 [Colobus angolensis palliatus]|nr:PREDICTED: protein FAM209B-like isoform X2 [Colobus angolensis palliatus]